MGGFLGAVSLLTRVPVRSGGDLARAAGWLPTVGALIGFAVAGVYAGLLHAVPPAAAAIVAIAAGVVLTGALHEDGLADVADAFGARADRARTLEILKDPRHGTYGVLALILSVGARAAALAAMSASSALVALPAAHALARGAAAAQLGLLPPATDEGLGARYASTPRRALLATMSALAIGSLTIGAWTVPAALLAAAAAALMGAMAVGKIGGVTGDVLGASEQLAETAILLLCAGAEVDPWIS